MRLSVSSVPTTLISTTVEPVDAGHVAAGAELDDQDDDEERASSRSRCRPGPRPRPLRKSAAVSPTVVARILMIQKKTVTSGTLLSRIRPGVVPSRFVCAM